MDFKRKLQVELLEDIFDARFHPSKEGLIVAATIGGNVRLIGEDCSHSPIRKHHKGTPIRRLRFDAQEHLVTVAKTVKIYDMEAQNTIRTLRRSDDAKTMFNALQTLGESIICAGDDDGSVFVWDTRTADGQPVFTASDCEQYISDIDGKFGGRQLFVCTSGEGTLTAYDLRANKMIEPQSELFEAGFQCVKMVKLNKKVVIGAEDGAVYVFNQNEWAHTSGKFAVSDDAQNRGKCSIESIDLIPNTSVFVLACSDGRLRSLTLWPHQVQSEQVVCKRNSLECLQVNPIEGKSELLVVGENCLNLMSYEEKSDDESDTESSTKKEKKKKLKRTSGAAAARTSGRESDSDSDSDSESCSENSGPDEVAEGGSKPSRRARESEGQEEEETSGKKSKTDTTDYLNVFK